MGVGKVGWAGLGLVVVRCWVVRDRLPCGGGFLVAGPVGGYTASLVCGGGGGCLLWGLVVVF